MPRLAELRHRFSTSIGDAQDTEFEEEVLVSDPRNGLAPHQIVESKFGSALLREHDRKGVIPSTFRNRPR